jgi:hypothetical protein
MHILFYIYFFRTTPQFIQPTVKRNSLEERLLDYIRQLREHVSTAAYDVKQDFTESYTSHDSNQIYIKNNTDNFNTYAPPDQANMTIQFDLTKEKVTAYMKDEHLQPGTDTMAEQFIDDYTVYDASEITTDNLEEVTYQYTQNDELPMTTLLDENKAAVISSVHAHDGSQLLNDTIPPITMMKENRSHLDIDNNKTLGDMVLYTTSSTNDSYYNGSNYMSPKNTSLMVLNKNYYGPLQDIIRHYSEPATPATHIYGGHEMTETSYTLQEATKVIIYKYVIFITQ